MAGRARAQPITSHLEGDNSFGLDQGVIGFKVFDREPLKDTQIKTRAMFVHGDKKSVRYSGTVNRVDAKSQRKGLLRQYLEEVSLRTTYAESSNLFLCVAFYVMTVRVIVYLFVL